MLLTIKMRRWWSCCGSYSGTHRTLQYLERQTSIASGKIFFLRFMHFTRHLKASYGLYHYRFADVCLRVSRRSHNRMPSSGLKWRNKNRWTAVRGFSYVCGAVDCSLFDITRPTEYKWWYCKVGSSSDGQQAALGGGQTVHIPVGVTAHAEHIYIYIYIYISILNQPFTHGLLIAAAAHARQIELEQGRITWR